MRHRVDDLLYAIPILELVILRRMIKPGRGHYTHLCFIVGVVEEALGDGMACWVEVGPVTMGWGSNTTSFPSMKFITHWH